MHEVNGMQTSLKWWGFRLLVYLNVNWYWYGHLLMLVEELRGYVNVCYLEAIMRLVGNPLVGLTADRPPRFYGAPDLDGDYEFEDLVIESVELNSFLPDAVIELPPYSLEPFVTLGFVGKRLNMSLQLQMLERLFQQRAQELVAEADVVDLILNYPRQRWLPVVEIDPEPWDAWMRISV